MHGSLSTPPRVLKAATVVGGLNRIIDDLNNGRTVFYDFYRSRRDGGTGRSF
jgi:hypothetical protein